MQKQNNFRKLINNNADEDTIGYQQGHRAADQDIIIIIQHA